MSENTIEEGDEAQAAEDEQANQQLGRAYSDDVDEAEEHRRQLADEEHAE